MALNLTKITIDFLKSNQGQKFTAKEIAEWIFANYPEECKKKQQRSKATVIPLDTNDALINQLVREITAKNTRLELDNIKTTADRPREYYYTELSDSDEIQIIEEDVDNSSAQVNQKPREHDLYPILSEFLWSELNIYSKRIDEKKSSNRYGQGGNKWLHPDIVGLEDLSRHWNHEVKDCVQHYYDKKTKLWSFEVKIKVNLSNLREVFFQTISNSSWANFGYLVANVLDDKAAHELRILSSLHGIGFIKLNTENPAESQIQIPARERPQIDWDNVNRILEENTDFKEYIKFVRQFYQTGEIRKNDWDQCE
ncbi:COG2958 family protein [Legionella spiritensis]|uniref:HrgA protein n=1 Tax=Legionella spiritensis TaxID=452 RepID=A0A0W0YZ66_LEGSP|nr:hypothetical protein [Legionella spiritensis]KTD62123.1 hypothetical protein Lspi_1973 [Legionella spiritensis]SNV34102.1 Uncharacterized protein conserved in bacteria [Legionella spiritensis]